MSFSLSAESFRSLVVSHAKNDSSIDSVVMIQQLIQRLARVRASRSFDIIFMIILYLCI